MINDYLRKDLNDFKPYHAPEKEYEVKIDANENPYSHSPEVLSKACQWLLEKDNITRYPDTDQHKLREKLAEIHHVSKDNITCGVGSDQLIEYIIKAFIEPGNVILSPNPSFSMYALSNTLNHGKTINYELEKDFSYNIDHIIDLYKEHNPKIIFICTPNNPTGTTINKEKLHKLLEVVKCPVVIDEAYGEFINEGMINEVSSYKQIVVLRTFSKAFGLAGLRVGYAIASQEMIEAINICKAPYNLSSFSAKMAMLVLEYLSYYQEQVQVLLNNRTIFMKQLKCIPTIEEVYPSEANFVLVKVKNIDIIKILENNKILVRGYGTEGRLAYCMRITVGTKEENEILIQTLNKYK
ncbi:MAG: histidinol-phosphate transaminase [Firmicutes bacterium HGW-Firmicutes-7]|nr:MAG: histidinol-phosphate transaminase [Firmicutes bacterium HGW-Firmicutes-7]